MLYGSIEVDVCCRCLAAPARCFGGHVTHGPHIVLAGWCQECNEEMHGSASVRLHDVARKAREAREGHPPTLERFLHCTIMGWCGHWVPAMGLRLRGSPDIASMRAARREQRIARNRPPPRARLAASFDEATPPISNTTEPK